MGSDKLMREPKHASAPAQVKIYSLSADRFSALTIEFG